MVGVAPSPERITEGGIALIKFGYWIREIMGWLLLLAGLWVFWLSIDLLREGLILRGPPIALVGFVIFRGGIHLLKVAVAARLTDQARRDLEDPSRRSRVSPPPARVGTARAR